MSLNLEDVNKQVNSNLELQAPTPTLTTQVAEAAALVIPVEADEIRVLRDEVASLKREAARQQATLEDTLSESRLRLAHEIAHSRPAEKVNNGMADVELHHAIAACGGPCYWERLTDSEKETALGIQGGAQTKDSDIKRIVGRTSDSAAANRLSLSNPAEYKRLRLLAKLRKLY